MSAGVVKICGVRTLEDAAFCVSEGVDLVGFNFFPPSPRYVEPEKVREIVSKLDLADRAVAVVVDLPLDALRMLVEASGTGWVQLHGREAPGYCRAARRLARVIRGVRLKDRKTVETLSAYDVDWLLLDAYSPQTHGGTGQRADWSLARLACTEHKVLLAGGLSPANVAEAIRAVRPAGVDTATGVESAPGEKSCDLIRRFVQQARAAFAGLAPA